MAGLAPDRAQRVLGADNKWRFLDRLFRFEVLGGPEGGVTPDAATRVEKALRSPIETAKPALGAAKVEPSPSGPCKEPLKPTRHEGPERLWDVREPKAAGDIWASDPDPADGKVEGARGRLSRYRSTHGGAIVGILAVRAQRGDASCGTGCVQTPPA